MLTSMFPAVRGTGLPKARRILLLLAAVHSLGSVLAAAAVGGLLALANIACDRLNISARPLFAALAIGVSLVYLPRVLGWLDYPPLLQSTRQVPRNWGVTYRGWRVALFWGLALGSGLYTRIVVPSYYVLIIWPFLGAGLAWSLAMWSAYGFARTINAWWFAFKAEPANPLPQAENLNAAVHQWTTWMFRANALVMVVAILLAIKGL